MTKFVRRAKETAEELTYLATKAALDSAGMKIDQVDGAIHATAPDAFDGVHMKGEYLAAASGGCGKPFMRSYVGGGSGVFAPIHGWYMVASGYLDTCLVVCEEKMSSCQPHPQGAFLTIFDHTTERPLKPNLLWIFALEMNRYLHTYGISIEEIAQVSVKNKKNAIDHPCAQLGKSLTVQD
ncbi:MAG: thiolase domain-containing protein, partial [Planctomycetes bacterium]|nr:thiolase domain-containing protein [Planctomycetota bacterium]